MTAMPSKADAPRRPADALFAATVFLSAALVFLVEPMVAKLVLPQLGGSASVWNTSLAFFQTALLAGYGYAHALQRLKSLKRQAIVHGVVLLAAAYLLPTPVPAISVTALLLYVGCYQASAVSFLPGRRIVSARGASCPRTLSRRLKSTRMCLRRRNRVSR